MAITAPSWRAEVPQNPRHASWRGGRPRSLPAFSPPIARGTVSRRIAGKSTGLARSRSGTCEPLGSVRGLLRTPTSADVLVPDVSRVASLRSSRTSRRSDRGHGPVGSAGNSRYGFVAALAVLIAMLVLVAPGISAQASRTVTEGPAQSIVTVRAGDSLWSVATSAMPETDPRSAVRELRELNKLKGTSLAPGQQLLIPTQ